MTADDRLAVDTADARNAVESYIYSMRDNLSYELKEFASAAEREALAPVLEAAEEWLYDEGEDQTKSVYVEKLAELRKLGDPIERRRKEDVERPAAVKQLESTITEFIVASTTDLPAYEHIEASDKERVKKRAEEVKEWLNTEQDKQFKLPKTSDPTLLVSMIRNKQVELHSYCSAIMSKPKPKPKPAPKPAPATEAKAEPAPESDAAEATPAAEEKKEEAPEPAAEEAEATPMNGGSVEIPIK